MAMRLTRYILPECCIPDLAEEDREGALRRMIHAVARLIKSTTFMEKIVSSASIALRSVVILTFFALLASCASEGSGGPNDNSAPIARAGPAGLHGSRTHTGNRIEAANATPPAMVLPQSIAFDQAGNLYVADTPRNRILRIDASGRTTTYAGTGRKGYSGDGGPARSASLSAPTGLAFDRDGNLIILDSGNGRLRMVASDGTMKPIAAAILDSSSSLPADAPARVPTDP